MNPCCQDDRATLYQGEALAVLASLEDESIDAVIADPPYSLQPSSTSDAAVWRRAPPTCAFCTIAQRCARVVPFSNLNS